MKRNKIILLGYFESSGIQTALCQDGKLKRNAIDHVRIKVINIKISLYKMSLIFEHFIWLSFISKQVDLFWNRITYIKIKQDTYHVITESDCSKRYHTVVNRVEVAPALVVREHRSTACRYEKSKQTGHTDHLGLTDLDIVRSHALFHHFNAEWAEVVQALTHRLEHDKTERYADESVAHAEYLAHHGLRSAVAVADGGYHRETEIERPGEFPSKRRWH